MRIADFAMTIIAAATVIAQPAPTLTEFGAAVITSYSCEAGNTTTTCDVTRWGGDPLAIGAACPETWQDKRIVVEGMEYLGVIRCDDTGKHDYLYGMPHIDVRLPTRQAAVEVGIQTRNVWEQTP